MDAENRRRRQRAIKALREAVGDMKPMPGQVILLNSMRADAKRAYHGRGKGAGQSTFRMMAALRLLEDDE